MPSKGPKHRNSAKHNERNKVQHLTNKEGLTNLEALAIVKKRIESHK
jgi:hypothetical protein